MPSIVSSLANVTTERVTLSKGDLLAAWKSVEKLVGSLRRMGTHYAVPGKGDTLPPVLHAEMLEELNSFMDAKLWRELVAIRSILEQALPRDELEKLSEEQIAYWKPPTP